MASEKELSVTWETPESYFGVTEIADADVEAIVRRYFAGADRFGSGGGLNSRDIDWKIEDFVDQPTLDRMGRELALLSRGRIFHVNQTAWDFEDENEPQKDALGGCRGKYQIAEKGN